ncbi:2-polyprenyl-6-methoxyphenol hydroxylase [Saccharomonospora piscinae]|uniref:2-polyprenyl-6-methoxyphenol hydroxylase n=1 Tax=Saccharomonospora piscinae TaxID=687388 RepID=A0A1V9A4F2_SACPI|nr:FAD-dependent monooxygenase [Saccharomonospora piscinae]OQO92025.1 2-polyprenyl-6-methoxyphenol hydroxylase [Saccharomonospora piscinae]
MDVLISGASVAGPVLAYWLHRRGFRPVVVERTPELRVGLGGHAVDLFAPAMTVAGRMGLVPALREADTRTGTLVLERDGRRATEVRLDTLVPALGADRHVEVMRGDLTTLLHRATRDDVEYVFGDSVATLAEDTSGVDVTFESGTRRRFALVVGADGLHSRIRELAFGPERRFTRYLGGYLAVFSLPNYRGLEGRTLLYNGVNRMAVLYPVHRTGQARAVLLFRRARETAAHHRDREAQLRLVREEYAGEGWEVPRLLREMSGADDFYLDSISQVHLPSWSKGRVTLVGDAGYSPGPAVGGGTTLAMVAAYVLAHSLASAPGDHAAAFADYEARIGDYVRRCREAAPRALRNGVPRSATQRAVSEASLRLLPRLPGWLSGRLLSRGVSAALSAFTLPD